MAKVIVLRPFVFSHPARPRRPGDKIASELRVSPERDSATKEFIPTEVDLPDEVAEHEWIKGQYADGCIEPPAKTRARLDAVRKKREKEQEEATRIVQQAEAALARASRGHEVKEVREVDVDKELNTPINVLRAQQGDDLDKVPPLAAKGKKG